MLYNNQTVCVRYMGWSIWHGVGDMDEVGVGVYIVPSHPPISDTPLFLT